MDVAVEFREQVGISALCCADILYCVTLVNVNQNISGLFPSVAEPLDP